MSLNPNEIAAFQPSLAPYKKTDGKGLYLHVMPSGAKYWRLRYRWAGKQNTLSCGVYPETSLEQARAQRDVYRRLLADGVNPSEYAKAGRARGRDAQARLAAATRFMVDSNGGLSVRLGNRHVDLTPAETAELRRFLDETRQVGGAYGID